MTNLEDLDFSRLDDVHAITGCALGDDLLLGGNDFFAHCIGNLRILSFKNTRKPIYPIDVIDAENKPLLRLLIKVFAAIATRIVSLSASDLSILGTTTPPLSVSAEMARFRAFLSSVELGTVLSVPPSA